MHTLYQADIYKKMILFLTLLVTSNAGSGDSYDYKTLYIEQPLIAIWKDGNIPHYRETDFLVRKNIAWRDRKDDRKLNTSS